MRKILTVIWMTCVLKISQIWTLIRQLLAKYQFSRHWPKFNTFTRNCIFSRKIEKQTNCFYLINFMALAWDEYTLFQFCQLWVVKLYKVDTHSDKHSLQIEDLHTLREQCSNMTSDKCERLMLLLEQVLPYYFLHCKKKKKKYSYLEHFL